ncbi:MAG: hypothetical protein ACAI25_12880 [Planctomycetota bacterium]
MHRHAIALLFALLLTGCPESGKGSGDPASVNSGVPMSGKIQKKPKDPTGTPAEPAKKPDVFPREVLVELYRAEQLGDKTAVFKKHGLLDAKGVEVPAKEAEYEAALQRFATESADEWSKLVDEIESAKAKAAKASDVQKK